jgi:AcrR family transcriptional regulator
MKMSRSPHSNRPPSALPYAQVEQPFGGGFGVAIETRYRDIVDAACEVFARRGFHQASMRQIAGAAGLSLAGLYHYVGGKEELLFLALDRSLDALIAALDRAGAAAPTPETKLLALIRTHLEFAFEHASALRIVNRDYELLGEPRRGEIVAKRQAYLQRGLAILRELDPHRRAGDELLWATNLLLGMLNGIARRPFLQGSADARALAAEVGALFLYGFLERTAVRGPAPAAVPGGDHDA